MKNFRNCEIPMGRMLALFLFFSFSSSTLVPRAIAQEVHLTFYSMNSSFVADTESVAPNTTALIDNIPNNRSGSQETYVPKWYSMLTNLPGDWSRFSAETFVVKNIPLALGIAGLTGGLMIADNTLWQHERKFYDRSTMFRTFSNDMVWLGDGRTQFGVVGAFAVYGFAFNNDRALRTASEITEAILATGGVVQILKHVTGRERPNVASEIGGDWTFFPSQISYLKHVPHYDAFPSGHIATATTTFVVIAENYPELTWFKPFSFVVLGGISSSLVAYGIHWWSDIPLGILLGYSLGEIVSHPLAVDLAKKTGTEPAKLSFEPVLLPGGFGAGLRLSF